MNSVVVIASRCVERRRKKESETRLDADLPITVVAPLNNELDGNESVLTSSELLLDELRVIIISLRQIQISTLVTMMIDDCVCLSWNRSRAVAGTVNASTKVASTNDEAISAAESRQCEERGDGMMIISHRGTKMIQYVVRVNETRFF